MKFYKFGKSMWESGKIPPGIQLYTVKDEFKENTVGTLKTLAEMGHKTVEFAGYNNIPSSLMAKYLQQFGLKAPASHVLLENLKKNLKKEIQYAKEVGIQYIVIPTVSKDTFYDQKKYQELITSIERIAKQLKHHHIQLIYHNHAHEFEQLSSGEFVLDRFIRDVGSNLIQLELDLYWVKKMGLDPIKILQRYKGNVPLIHVKDMDKEGKTTELGKGIINYRSILSILCEVGVNYYFIEQEDFKRSPLESAQLSLEYLHSMLESR
ncbi:sugar phosphate isomerase/epimerase family protein [Metabacillus arenae]|uniref:Sugar phosphate isomerase/epimerase n=1 Tax=Metabacillus arenae TaxID=2771434 RepID=A0A926NG48_9BACI|nr:sugar phosphate isomerase/epimerase [Metabacillus arenae]MBD1379873.1 sugar phosphate isomerase/epimerase [Metabacillus arenae]